MSNWPFDTAKNEAVTTEAQLVLAGTWVQYVSRHEMDGSWQFLGPEPPLPEDVVRVTLGEMVRLHPEISELADLPRGWCAYRKGPNEPWKVVPKEAPVDEAGG